MPDGGHELLRSRDSASQGGPQGTLGEHCASLGLVEDVGCGRKEGNCSPALRVFRGHAMVARERLVVGQRSAVVP